MVRHEQTNRTANKAREAQQAKRIDTLKLKSKGSYPANPLVPDKMDRKPRATGRL